MNALKTLPSGRLYLHSHGHSYALPNSRSMQFCNKMTAEHFVKERCSLCEL